MEGRHDFDAAKVLKLSAHARNPFAHFQQISQRSVSHHDDHIRFNGGDLAKQKGPADCGLLEGRLTITRRPAAVDVANQNVFALHADRFNDLGKQLSSAADERFALRVFISARSFPDKHQTRLEVSKSIDDLRSSFAQTAAGAVTDITPHILHPFDGLKRCRSRDSDFAKKGGWLWWLRDNRRF